MIAELVGPLLALLAVLFVLTQCVVPAMLGRPWFPLFRRGYQVRHEIEEALEEAETEKLEEKLHQIQEMKHGVHQSESPGDSSNRTDS